jgi:hypothetical protein
MIGEGFFKHGLRLAGILNENRRPHILSEMTVRAMAVGISEPCGGPREYSRVAAQKKFSAIGHAVQIRLI